MKRIFAFASMTILLLCLVAQTFADDTLDQQTSYDGYQYLHSTQFLALGNAFTYSGGVNKKITSVTFMLQRGGSPTGNAYAKLYNCTGTPGTNGQKSGSAIATSDALDVSTLNPSSEQPVNLTFSGINQVTLTNNTDYCITLEYSGGDSSNYIYFYSKNSIVGSRNEIKYYYNGGSPTWQYDNGITAYCVLYGTNATSLPTV